MLCSQDDEGRTSSGVEDRPGAGEEELQQNEYCEREQGRELSEEDEIEEEDEEEDEEEAEEEEEDDGEGWITPSNLKQVQLESGDWTAPADIKVGCLTTDFAMQVM